MAFGGFQRPGTAAPMAEINMIPLIDVMLVLLVIFLVTAPLLTHSVKLDLPRASSTSTPTPPRHIELSIDAAGSLYWNGERVSREALRTRLASAAREQPQPEVQMRADRNARYQPIAEAMADASSAGIARIAFLSEPERR